MATKSSKTSASAPKRKRTSTAPAAASVPPPAPRAEAGYDGASMVGSSSPKPTPSHADIAFRAFELYQQRSHAEGGALHDWLAAERELRAS